MLKLNIVSNQEVNVDGNHEDIAWLNDKLSFFDPSAKYAKSYQMGWWDGKVKFLSQDRMFPIGLIPHVFDLCDKHSVDVVITNDYRNDPSNIPKKLYKKLSGVRLRDYQVDAVRSILTHKVSGHPFPRGIIHAATNAGKSLMAASICRSLHKIPRIFLCHKVEIFDQVVSWFNKYLPKEAVGVYNSKESYITDLTVAMLPTIYSRRSKPEVINKIFNRFECVIVDEAHHASSDSWALVIESFHKAYYKIGLTGTAIHPDEHRNVRLIGLLGPVVYEITNRELVDMGYSAKPEVLFIDYKSPSLSEVDPGIIRLEESIRETRKIIHGLKKKNIVNSALDYELKELQRRLYSRVYGIGISTSPYRASATLEAISSHYRDCDQILIIVNHIQHGKFLRDYMRKRDIKCTFVSGRNTSDFRIEVKRKFSEGKIRVLISTMIYKEGVDIPSIDVLVLAMAAKSPITVLQTFGRGLRKGKNKDRVTVYDFEDITHNTLANHSDLRRIVYEKQGFDPENLELY